MPQSWLMSLAEAHQHCDRLRRRGAVAGTGPLNLREMSSSAGKRAADRVRPPAGRVDDPRDCRAHTPPRHHDQLRLLRPFPRLAPQRRCASR